MQLDSLIRQRMSELETKANAISAAKYAGEALRGRQTLYVPHSLVVAWGTSVISLFRQVFGEAGVHTQHFQQAYINFSGHYLSFDVLLALFNAAREDYEGGYVFSVQGLVKAEVLTDALEQAEALLKAGYKDPACVLVGVSLETAVKHLAAKNGIPIAKLDKMNHDLSKAGAYNMAKQKQITAWAELRNRSAHGEWSAYTSSDVVAMLSGVQQFVADHL